MSPKRSLLLIVMLSFVAGLVGCGGSGDQVVARVGDYDITAREFGDFFQVVRYPFPTAQDEFDKRREILDTMIVKRLLIQAAYEKNINKLEELHRVVLANKDKFLLDILYKTQVSDKAGATETEAKAFWTKLEYQIRASHILVDSLSLADSLLERIRQGDNFDKLAYDHSIDRSAQRNRGDLGYFLWGAMVPEFQEVAFQMEPGQVSKPVKSDFGYHIIKVVDRLPNDQRTDFASMKTQLIKQIKAKKQSARTLEFFELIQAKYPITIDTTTCDYLLKKRSFLYPPSILENLPRSDFDVEQLDRNEKELVLATWDGGQMTILEYLEQVKQVPANIRPDFDDYDSLAVIVFGLKRVNILSSEALRLGLDKEKEYMRKVRLFLELNMADIMRNDSLPKPATPDDGEMRQYYDEHPEEFVDPVRIHVFEILLSDELKAQKLKEELRTLNEFRSSAMDLTERPGKRSIGGDLDYIEREWYPDIFDLARKTKVGTVGGPVVTRGKYSIFWVADIVAEELRGFLDEKNSILQILIAQNSRKIFDDWLEERRSGVEIEIDEDALWEMVDRDQYASTDNTGQDN